MITLATDGSGSRANEDYAVAGPGLIVMVDGAGVGSGGCIHGVVWYARQLAAQTMAALVRSSTTSLRDGLGEALTSVAAMHARTCDLASPSTPCAAVGIVRIGEDVVDTLALSDVTVAVDTADGPQITLDLSIEELNGTEQDTLAGLAIGSPEHRRALAELVERQTLTRNKPNGWWVAASDPAAAQYAVINQYDRAGVRRLAACTDGATRPADQMGIYTWAEYFDLLDKLGPAGLIGHVREIESSDPVGSAYPRTKKHDDATIAFVADLDA